MKKRYFLPLAGFLLVTGIPSALIMPKKADMILDFAIFLIGFTATYLSMVGAALRNRDPICKIDERTPFVMPVLIFSLSTICSAAFTIPRDAAIVFSFAVCFLLSILAYGSGAAIILKGLRADSRIQAEPQAPQAQDTRKTLV